MDLLGGAWNLIQRGGESPHSIRLEPETKSPPEEMTSPAPFAQTHKIGSAGIASPAPAPPTATAPLSAVILPSGNAKRYIYALEDAEGKTFITFAEKERDGAALTVLQTALEKSPDALEKACVAIGVKLTRYAIQRE